MSKNFELLQRLNKDQVMFETGQFSLLPAVPEEPPQHLNPEKQQESLESRPNNVGMLAMSEKQHDEIMRIVSHVFLTPGRETPRTIAFIAPERGNGCSWICSRAAEILAARVRGPVCLVDANLRSPGLHADFGVENHHGLSDALKGTESIRNFVCTLHMKNLWLLSCGSDATNSRSLLTSDVMRHRLVELRQYFEYILIDSPALNPGGESVALGRAAEGVVLVLKANSSRREVARTAVLDLQNAGAKILGAVLNQRTFPIPQAIYNKL